MMAGAAITKQYSGNRGPGKRLGFAKRNGILSNAVAQYINVADQGSKQYRSARRLYNRMEEDMDLAYIAKHLRDVREGRALTRQ